MPNTLAHLGFQALITRGIIARADLGWIWLGCIIPDLPWIFQRAVKALPLDTSPIDLRLYAVVQSTLLFSLVIAGAFAFLAPRPKRVFAILALGCVLHLMVDATQTKWANGVLLFAPLDWRLLNLGLYWPENWPSHFLGFLGLAYFCWATIGIGPTALRPRFPSTGRCIVFVALLGLYVAGPVPLIPAAEAADLHYAKTLRDVTARPGRSIEFDRAGIVRAPDGSAELTVWTGETFALTGQLIPDSARGASIQGRFVDAKTVEISAFHLHPAGTRDLLTVLGLGLVGAWWIAMLVVGQRTK